jgi:hypothetical protein
MSEEAVAQLVTAGRQQCAAEFPAGPAPYHAARARCFSDYANRVLSPHTPYPDLLAKLNATRVVVAEKLDRGSITEAEAASLDADARSGAISEQQRRDAARIQTGAQVMVARAAQSQATTAAMSASNPVAAPAATPCPVLVGGRCR